MSSIYDFEARQINGKDIALSQFKGKVMLIVNTASKCGFTPQFGGLEELHKSYTGKGLVVLGFPCNQFGSQDPAADGEIAEFCQVGSKGIKWNFTKFLVGKDGQVIRRYAPTDKPEDLAKDIEAALAS